MKKVPDVLPYFHNVITEVEDCIGEEEQVLSREW